MANLLVILIVLIILTAVIAYIVKEKKRGVVCIGCPAAGQCSRANCGGGCGNGGSGGCSCGHSDSTAVPGCGGCQTNAADQ